MVQQNNDLAAGVPRLVAAALAEDLGPGDWTTSAIVAPDARCHFYIVAKAAGTISGLGVAREAFEQAGADLDGWHAAADGARVSATDRIVHARGRTAGVLAGERVALNFLQRLSGIATLACAFADAVEGTRCRVVDTRKTTPLLRDLEKRAVRDGGATNHRYGLFDGVLIKDNHIAAAGGVGAAIEAARANAHHLLRIEVEVTSLEELGEALEARADVVLLDNMELDTMREAVFRTAGRAQLEASGNVTLERVRAIAETGVDFVSVGALTHSAPALDLSLRIEAP